MVFSSLLCPGKAGTEGNVAGYSWVALLGLGLWWLGGLGSWQGGRL